MANTNGEKELRNSYENFETYESALQAEESAVYGQDYEGL